MSSTDESKSARLFFALWPDETLRSRLVGVIGGLRKTMSGKWVRPENLHLTLAFLGEVSAERLPEVLRIGAETTGTGFTLVLDRAEFWPRNGIICLGASETPPALKAVAENLTGYLGEAGFALEKRAFRVHLTLARKGRSDRTRIELPEPISWKVDGFRLVESRLSQEGSVYIRRETWPLQDSKSIPGTLPVR
jgi:2'-5' RNA ligase